MSYIAYIALWPNGDSSILGARQEISLPLDQEGDSRACLLIGVESTSEISFTQELIEGPTFVTSGLGDTDFDKPLNWLVMPDGVTIRKANPAEVKSFFRENADKWSTTMDPKEAA